MTERKGEITFKGQPLTLVGEAVNAGDDAPDFVLLANDLTEVKLADVLGKTTVISVVPSLDTAVCDLQTRRFNAEAVKLGSGINILTVSMDLPFAQKRWCGAAGAEAVKTLSDHRDASFGKNWGVLIKELRLLARSVFIVDKSGKVRYVQQVKEMTTEPDYDDVLAALAKITK
ncbi:MAG: thiol peroxidase [Planctomycetaceae bacterium]|nr:thiol peroxidase [Planctomycetaceae bacterium]